MEARQQLNLIQFLKFISFIGFLLGLLAGVIYSFGGLVVDTLVSLDVLAAETFETPGLSKGTLLAFGALIGMPIIGAGFGLALSVVGGLLYNIVSRILGTPNFNIFKN